MFFFKQGVQETKRGVMKHKKTHEPDPLETRFRGLLEFTPDAVIITDSEGRILLINKHVESLFGYSSEELIDQPVEILLPERFREKHTGHRKGYLLEPRPRPMGSGLDLAGRRRDGSEFPVEISLTPVKTEDGFLITSIIRDITEQKRDRDEIRKLNRELEQRVIERTAELLEERDKEQKYLDIAGVMLVVINVDQKVAQINKKGCEVLGYEEKEIVGKNWFDMFLPETERDRVKDGFVKLVAGDFATVEYFKNPILTKSGDEKLIAWHNTVLKDKDGKTYATLSSGTDITEKEELERQVRESEKLAAVGQLTSGLAHEIGTPLNVIIGRAEYMLRKMPPEDPLRKNLESIISQIERITKIVQQLLSYTRMKPQEIRPVRIESMLNGILALFEHQWVKQDIATAVHCPEKLPDIMADPDQIQQVCFNIVLNAIEAMPQGGRLAIHASQTAQRRYREDPIGSRYVKISFSDTGNGIQPQHLHKLFDPFFSTKEVGKGTGLGLTVSYNIMKSHGGWIDVKSRVEGGTVFTLYLPVKLITAPITASVDDVRG
jgi:PAS domain S-box-containing protein